MKFEYIIRKWTPDTHMDYCIGNEFREFPQTALLMVFDNMYEASKITKRLSIAHSDGDVILCQWYNGRAIKVDGYRKITELIQALEQI